VNIVHGEDERDLALAERHWRHDELGDCPLRRAREVLEYDRWPMVKWMNVSTPAWRRDAKNLDVLDL
jgi:hypothetical protein